MWWQLFLQCCWCWGLWERGLCLDWMHLHSIAMREEELRIEGKRFFNHENLRQLLP